jgi:tight adherence protein B
MTGGVLTTMLVFLAVFLSIFAVNLILVDLFKRDREKALRRMQEQLQAQQRKDARHAVRNRRDQNLGQLADEAFQENPTIKSLAEHFRELVEQSGMKISTKKLALISTASALVSGGLVGLLFQSLLLGLAAATLAAAIPLGYVAQVRRRRQNLIREQLPDVLELMARILRAGQTITQAMNSVADEFKPPIGLEFSYCYEQQNLGLAPEVALKDLAQRTGLVEIKIFVLAVLVHRQAGGNLAELLDRLSHIVRERFRIRGEIKSLTAEGRMQAAILLLLPIFVWLGLLIINRGYAMKLLDHPVLVMGTIGVMGLGAVWIRRIVNFDF